MVIVVYDGCPTLGLRSVFKSSCHATISGGIYEWELVSLITFYMSRNLMFHHHIYFPFAPPQKMPLQRKGEIEIGDLPRFLKTLCRILSYGLPWRTFWRIERGPKNATPRRLSFTSKIQIDVVRETRSDSTDECPAARAYKVIAGKAGHRVRTR